MKKVLSLMVTCFLIIAMFAGCGSGADDQTDGQVANDETTVDTPDTGSEDEATPDADAEESDEAEDVSLRIVTMFGGTDPATQVFEQQLADFQADHPNVTIVNESMTSVGDEFRTAVKTDFSTGNEADVIFFYTGADAQGIIEAGGVVPYEEVWNDFPEVGQDISQGILDSVKEFDGNIYALPLTGFYEGLFVNKEIFDTYGLELPTDWDKLTTAIETLSAEGIVPIAGPVAQSHYMIEHFILAQAGVAEHQDSLEGDVPQSWIDGLDTIKTFYDMNAFADNAISMEIEEAQNLFKSEDAAMILEGSWFIGGCEPELQEKMTVIPMPAAPGGKKDPSSIIAGFSSGYYISRNAYDDPSKQQSVVDLVTALTTADAIKDIATANGGSPSANVQVEGLPQVAMDGHQMAANAVAMDMPIDSRLTSEAFNYIVKEGVPFIAYGQSTAEDVLTEVKEIQNR